MTVPNSQYLDAITQHNSYLVAMADEGVADV